MSSNVLLQAPAPLSRGCKAALVMVLSGVIGVLVTEPTQLVASAIRIIVDCRLADPPEYGIRLQDEAIAVVRTRRLIDKRLSAALDEQHKRANQALASAARCGSAEAMMRQAVAACFGLGVDPDPQLARKLASGATPKEPKLALIWEEAVQHCPADSKMDLARTNRR